MVLGMGVGLTQGDNVIDGDPDPLRKNGAEPRSPIFGPFLLCQTAGCIKMLLGMELGRPQLRGLCVRWGPSPPPQKGGGATSPRIFGACQLRPNGCMDQYTTWYGDRPRHHVRWGPSYPSPKRGRIHFPNFRPTSVVAKRLDGSRWHLVQATLC